MMLLPGCKVFVDLFAGAKPGKKLLRDITGLKLADTLPARQTQLLRRAMG